MAFGSGSSLATDRWMRRGGLPSSAQALSVGRATWLHQHSSKKPTAHSGSAPATSISRSRRLFFFRTRGRGDAPPLSERVRIPDEPVDSCDGLRGGLRRGTHRRARLGGDGAGDAFAPARGSLDAGEAVDNLPDPLHERKKRRRDRLMEVAGADPEWAVGFLDECWWSRVALPTLNAWAEEGKPPRLIQRSVAKDD